jgi:hypothetical protein
MIPGKVLVPAMLVFIVAVTVAVIVLARKDDTQAVADSPSTSSPPALPAAEASRLAGDVTSGDEKRVRAAVAVAPEQPLDAEALSGLAAIESMAFDLRTFRDHGNGTAEVTAQVVMPGAQPVAWKVRLVAADRKWLISSTEPAQ